MLLSKHLGRRELDLVLMTEESQKWKKEHKGVQRWHNWGTSFKIGSLYKHDGDKYVTKLHI